MSVSKQFVFAIVIIISVLLLLEGAARLLEWQAFPSASTLTERPGWQAEFFGSLFDWHEPDPEILWRFKAGLENPLIKTNSHHLLGPEISSKKPDNTYRVLILGDSSPVGLGLKSRKQTFPEILRRLLDHHFVSRKSVEVINAAVSGYSSEQIARFLEVSGWDFKPNLVIVYCGNNDASISGRHTDRELMAGQRFKSLRRLLAHLAIYRVMRGIILPHKDAANDETPDLCVRVTPEQFGENLNCIAEQCYNHNCHVVFLKPPVPYLWPAGLQFKPFLHLTGSDGQILLPRGIADHLGEELIYCLDEEKYAQLYGKADIFTREVFESAYQDAKTAEEALRYYDEKIHQEPGNPTWYNNLGVTLWRVGEFQKAHRILQEALSIYYRKYRDSLLPPDMAVASPILFNLGINRLYIDSSMAHLRLDTSSKAYVYLDSALQSDFFSLRIKRPYWLELDKLESSPGSAVIDLPEIFRENGGEKLFIDHCHPTAEGHMLIAQSIYEKIIERRWL